MRPFWRMFAPAFYYQPFQPKISDAIQPNEKTWFQNFRQQIYNACIISETRSATICKTCFEYKIPFAKVCGECFEYKMPSAKVRRAPFEYEMPTAKVCRVCFEYEIPSAKVCNAYFISKNFNSI